MAWRIYRKNLPCRCRKAATKPCAWPATRNFLRRLAQGGRSLELAGLTILYDTIEIPLIHTLAVMEMNGFTVDTERLMDMERELSLEADKLEEEIYDDAGETFNINSTKQLGVILFEKLGLPVIKKTKTGYSTDSAVLEASWSSIP